MFLWRLAFALFYCSPHGLARYIRASEKFVKKVGRIDVRKRMRENEIERERESVSSVWCTTWRFAWKKSHKPVKKHRVSGPEESRDLQGEEGWGYASIAKRIPLMTNHTWFSSLFLLPSFWNAPSAFLSILLFISSFLFSFLNFFFLHFDLFGFALSFPMYHFFSFHFKYSF